jgi:hypothetical protein
LAGVAVYLRGIDPAVRDRIHGSMGSEVRAVLESASAATWHPVDHWRRALDAVVEAHPDEPMPVLQRTGKLIASEAVNSLVRLAMKLMTPSMFAKKTGQMLSKDFRGFPSGEPRTDIDLSNVDQNELHILVHEASMFPYLGATGMGFMEFAFESMGKKSIRIDDPECPANEYAPETIHWRIRWA